MTESRTDALMAHASDVLRNAPEPGWDRISDKVIRALRSTSASGWPLDAHASEGPRLGTVSVSDHVLRTHLAAEIRSRHHCSPSSIEFFVDGHEIRSLRIELAAPYGVDLAELSGPGSVHRRGRRSPDPRRHGPTGLCREHPRRRSRHRR